MNASSSETMDYDVAIIGGGPGGATAGAVLKKYNPDLRVLILEKERFPRDHVGESQLPACGFYLNEIGCWDKMEAANFPIKIGATYRWGSSPELWDFEFVPLSELEGKLERPGRYEGVRTLTAWQVDRAVYDDILLNHAAELGCEVRQGMRVANVHRTNDRVEALELADGSRVTAHWYIDASGHIGVLRRAMGIDRTIPTTLMNIAMWDYWTDARWATTIGSGGTRVQVLSIDDGWIWFIPISPTRTSVGFICPVEYYKTSGMSPAELYEHALAREPRVTALTRDAQREGEVRTTSDWSFVSKRLVGDNWFLVGEAAGFADPVLAGGLTLTHDSARAAAYIIAAILRGEHSQQWLTEHYEKSQKNRMMQYIRFADFWYAANGQFTSLEEHCAEIAKGSGVKLDPAQAFRWLSLGGFNPEDGGRPGIGGLDLGAVKEVTKRFVGKEAGWEVNKYNVFKLNLLRATEDSFPEMADGKIKRIKCYRRGRHVLPHHGVFGVMVEILKRHRDMSEIVPAIVDAENQLDWFHTYEAMAALETMVVDGWVEGKKDPRKPMLPFDPDGAGDSTHFHMNEDVIPS